MFSGDDEDVDFLSPTGGAKLASLFEPDQEAGRGNGMFQYTAPKQPKKGSTPATANQNPAGPVPGTPAVLVASAVQAFKYINGQYMKQGKLGAAVVGNHTAKEYKLLLYLSQQKQLTAARIHMGFIFTVQPNNYCTFYDDQRQNWSLMFESDKSSSDFCKEVCLAKANSVACLDSVVIQDLCPGEGKAVETGDSLEVVYTGWLLQNQAIGQMFDTNQNKDKLLRLKIGAGKVIKGWEEGMLGLKKAGRRLIVIPPSLAYGSKGVPNRVPPNSTLIFEVELRRAKFSKDNLSDGSSISSRDSASPLPAHTVESLVPEQPVPPANSALSRELPPRPKSNSLSEQLANPDATKAKLISRMAKMGQPMLPFMPEAANQPESSDSELEDPGGSRTKNYPAAPFPSMQPFTATSTPTPAHVHSHPAPASALVPVMTLMGSQSELQSSFQTAVTSSQMPPVNHVYPTQTPAYVAPGDMTSLLMIEARQQNTEVRLAVGKVADKVDQLASKIDDLQRHGSHFSNASMTMETTMIVNNIQRIVQENECLKKEVFEKNCRIEEQNNKISDLINQNQRCLEQSHLLMEQRNDSLRTSSKYNQTQLLQAEQDKVRLTEELASSMAKVSQVQLEASAHQQKAAELESKLNVALQEGENSRQLLAAQESQLEELKEIAEKAKNQYRSEKQKCKEMELKITSLEKELLDLKAGKGTAEQALSEREKNWEAERQRLEQEVEAIRRSSQKEVDNLRAQLQEARDSSNNSQQLQELEDKWRGKYEQMLASAKALHQKEVAELRDETETLRDELKRSQEQCLVLKQQKDSEDQTSLQQSSHNKELQELQEKYTDLQRQEVAVKERLERRVAELERRLVEQGGSADSTAEVKRVMNGVFHSLRAEFDLQESYSGKVVLGIIVTTIKNVTLQLLEGADRKSSRQKEEVNEEESEDVEDGQIKHKKVSANGQRDVKERETVETGNAVELKSEKVSESEGIQEANTTQNQTEVSPDFHASTKVEPAELEVAAESNEEPEQHSAADSSKEPEEPHDKPEEAPPVEELENNSLAGVEAESPGETKTSQRTFEPPVNPPPPPAALQNSSTDHTDVAEGVREHDEEQELKPDTTSVKPTAEDEEEEEMSLKGCPPPAPLFGDEEDDDLDWLN
ncbi:FK506-binding protein 15 [Oryzias melastigma]|uniref:peptidylprolyl isomerase n=1 Tax=Oryzias melastigma TaxID=30732 RepID=A0A834FLD6_ORYME|nr:FK506-binding protein 15 isoform X3 [Oryzias melastigma]KAF6736336.1 FK506-binding protein 15 [Oryzias melastigma]